MLIEIKSQSEQFMAKVADALWGQVVGEGLDELPGSYIWVSFSLRNVSARYIEFG